MECKFLKLNGLYIDIYCYGGWMDKRIGNFQKCQVYFNKIDRWMQIYFCKRFSKYFLILKVNFIFMYVYNIFEIRLLKCEIQKKVIDLFIFYNDKFDSF